MIQTPAFLNLPRGSVLVQDPDEEIFLLYTRKLQLAASSSSSSPPAPDTLPKTDGLGFAAEAGAVVPVTLTVTNPWEGGNAPAAAASSRRRIEKKKKKSESRETKLAAKDVVTVEVELHQSLDALRHRKGDTGSVLWRLSLHLAQYLLRMHHFPSDPPSRDHPALLPSLATSTVLELGSGTGFLGIALRDLVLAPDSDSDSDPERASGRWLFSDQVENLPLVVRNLRANRILLLPEEEEDEDAALSKSRGVGHRTPPAARGGPSSQQTIKRERRVEVLELDWLAEAVEWDREQQARSRRLQGGGGGHHLDGGDLADGDDELEGPLVLLAVDCIYNPSLSAPLAKTLLRQARLRSSSSSSSSSTHNARRRGVLDSAAANDPGGTVIVVASELRDEDALEAFLKSWMEAAKREEEDDEWTMARLGWDDPDERRVAGELASGQFVIWVAWKG